MALALPERVRVTLSRPPPGVEALPVAPRGLRRVGLVTGALFVVFAWIAVQQIGSIQTSEVETVFDVTFVAFQAFWVLAWSGGVAVLLVVTVLLLMYDESAYLTADRLVHVPRLGPLRIFLAYDLRRIHNPRLEESSQDDLARVQFDYRTGTVSLGNDLARVSAEETQERIRDAIRTALENPIVPNQPMEADGWTEFEERSGAPGIDLTRWLLRRAGARFPSTVSGREHAQGAAAGEAPGWTSASGAALIAANLVPLGGVLSLGWDLGQVMVLFWAENGIIGFYTLLRLARVAGWSVIVLGPFFVGHFGAFMAGHFIFIYALFVQGVGPGGSTEPAPVEALAGLLDALWPALLALFVSHGVSFYTNFVRKREFEGRNVSQQMMEPYKRVVILHVTIIAGGWMILAAGRPTWALVLLLGLKTAVDLRAHRREHRSGSAPRPGPARR